LNQDDEYLICVAKTEFREAYNSGDIERLIAVFAPKFIDWSEDQPSFYQEESAAALRVREGKLFQRFQVKLVINMAKITVMGAFATDRGWYKFCLTDKETGEEKNVAYRYFCTWAKLEAGWKISLVMTNKEAPPRLLASEDK